MKSMDDCSGNHRNAADQYVSSSVQKADVNEGNLEQILSFKYTSRRSSHDIDQVIRLAFREVCLVEIHAWKHVVRIPISFWVLLIVECAARSYILPTLHLLVQGPWHSCQLPLVAGRLQLPWPTFCRHLQTLYLLTKHLKWPKTILLDELQMQNPPFSRLLRPCVESESSNVCLGRTAYFRPLPCWYLHLFQRTGHVRRSYAWQEIPGTRCPQAAHISMVRCPLIPQRLVCHATS